MERFAEWSDELALRRFTGVYTFLTQARVFDLQGHADARRLEPRGDLQEVLREVRGASARSTLGWRQ